MEGVEPTRLAALDPKSSASANFATSAYMNKKPFCNAACIQEELQGAKIGDLRNTQSFFVRSSYFTLNVVVRTAFKPL